MAPSPDLCLVEHDVQKILHDSPWLVKGYCLILRPWNPNVHITKIDFAHETFWVQTHGLPFGKLTKAYAIEISPKVGTLVKVDFNDEGFQFDRSYLHFRAKVNFRKPLCPGFSLQQDGKAPLYISFKYEKLGDFYYSCGWLGHDVHSCGFDRDESISQVGAGMRAVVFKHPITSLRNEQPLHQTPGHPSTPGTLNYKVSNDTNDQATSTSPIDPIQITSHELVSHVASSSFSDPARPTSNTGSDTINVNFKQTNPMHNFSTTPMPSSMSRNPIFVPAYFVTEPSDSPPSSPTQNDSLIVKRLAITDDIDIIEENLSKLSVKRKPYASPPSQPTKKRSKQQPNSQSATPNSTSQSVNPIVPTRLRRSFRKYTSPKVIPKNVSPSIETQLNNLIDVPIEIMSVDDASVLNVGVVAAPAQQQAQCDFNLIGDVADKHGGSSNTSSRIEEFQSLLSTSELFELPFKGLNYTWDNNRADNANIQERIDRALANEMLLNLAHCAKDLTSWSRKNFQNNRKVIEELTNKLRLVQSETPMAANIARQRLLRKNLEETWRKEEMFWYQCSRVNWIKFGDQNTRFFHLSAIHRSQRNTITMLKNESGQLVDEPVALNTLILNHFTYIYTSVGVREFGDVFDVIQPVVTEHMNTSLEDTVVDYEIVRAVKQLGAYKSPGKDRFPGFMPSTLNKTLVVLIPKIPAPEQQNHGQQA
ncbi:hypothetical protein CTI12_AA135010 [Artemisia annua]|uniref:Zinc knuckle CX2CX4HX4C domain-containing protein n=1 Tax=Artemisia annua TaxID=35608 RepID=A0A2U1PLL2_ARTAN|nr:hypothetical protein CTI12_AA135010 [Artemisia annua]